ncbi:hypothetical protein N0V94_001241 [Neodidymelliopsis sp. IMI 364377]|nr:hypothetical protein N0V94_001241 [Neodidymelliopsis sp. IMI 364377]
MKDSDRGARSDEQLSPAADTVSARTGEPNIRTLQPINNTFEMPGAFPADAEQELKAQKYQCEILSMQFDQVSQAADQLQKQRDDFRKKYDKLVHRYQRLEHHYKFAHGRYTHIVQETILPYIQAKKLEWDHQTAETMAMVLQPLTIDAVEASELRIQVTTLQNEMLAKRDKIEIISDEQFAQDFRNLAALIKSLSRTVRPMQGVNLTEFTGSPGLLRGLSQEPWGARAGKKYLIEAWVWSVICDLLFQSPFGVHGQAGHDLATMWRGIFGQEHVDFWPSPSSLCEIWRCTTAEQLSAQLSSMAVSRGSTGVRETPRNLDLNFIDTHTQVYDVIMGFLTTISGVEDIPQVHSIIDKAFALALQMSLQRVRLQITYPCIGAAFDQSSMKPMDDPDDDDEKDEIEVGIVAFVVNPGLAKWGNAHGKNLDQRYDIVPSLVKVEATGPSHGFSLI